MDTISSMIASSKKMRKRKTAGKAKKASATKVDDFDLNLDDTSAAKGAGRKVKRATRRAKAAEGEKTTSRRSKRASKTAEKGNTKKAVATTSRRSSKSAAGSGRSSRRASSSANGTVERYKGSLVDLLADPKLASPGKLQSNNANSVENHVIYAVNKAFRKTIKPLDIAKSMAAGAKDAYGIAVSVKDFGDVPNVVCSGLLKRAAAVAKGRIAEMRRGVKQDNSYSASDIKSAADDVISEVIPD